LNEILHFLHVGHQAGFLRGDAVQRLVSTVDVLVHDVQGERVKVVFQLSGEGIGHPGELMRAHPIREVLAFGVLTRAGSGLPSTHAFVALTQSVGR